MKNRSKNRHISHTAQLALLRPTCTRVMKVDSITGVGVRGVKSHFTAVKWRRLQLALQKSEIIIFPVKLDFLYSDVTLK